MKTNSEIKNQASSALDGNWGMSAVITLVFLLIYQSPNLPVYIFELNGVLSLFDIIVILLLPLSFGYFVMFLNLIRGEKLEFVTLFEGFKDYGRILLTMLLVSIYTFLWAILLIVPGIIKSYSYSQTYFILRDKPELSYNAAIEESMRMMDGKKMKLFLLDLSFIGWFILSCLTLGIGFLFLYPYVTASHAVFYEGLKREKYGSIEVLVD